MPQQEILMIEDIIRNIIREELEKVLGPKQTIYPDGYIETTIPGPMVVSNKPKTDESKERLRITSDGAMIDSATGKLLGPHFDKQSGKPVDADGVVVELIEDTPVKQTVEIHNTADLMSELKQLVADKGAGTGAKAKKILLSHFDYSKFSEVLDGEAQTVYNKVVEEL